MNNGQDSDADVLDRLRDAGFAWRDVARIAGVHDGTLRRMRRKGEEINPGCRAALNRLEGLLTRLREAGFGDPVSWLETDVWPRVDMLAAGRFDLVLELSDVSDVTSVDTVLDRFDPDWRYRYVDDQFEVSRAQDGVMSIRSRP